MRLRLTYLSSPGLPRPRCVTLVAPALIYHTSAVFFLYQVIKCAETIKDPE